MEDVIASVREAFLDEGVDEQILQELRQVLVTFLVLFFYLYLSHKLFQDLLWWVHSKISRVARKYIVVFGYILYHPPEPSPY